MGADFFKHVDLDKLKAYEKLKTMMSAAIVKRQVEIIKKIRATFNPLQCL